MSLVAGAAAPAFSLPRDGGGTVSLASLKGRPTVVYFYPKASTSGCTVQAQDFSALHAAFAAIKVPVIGISADPVKKLDKFRDASGLNLILATDESHEVLTAYGVWVEKSMYGRKYMGIERTTFLIDGDGRINRIWPKVKIPGHAQEVLEAAKALAA